MDFLLDSLEMPEQELYRLLDSILAEPDFPGPRSCIAVYGNECAQSKLDQDNTFPGSCSGRNVSNNGSCAFTPPPDCSDSEIYTEFVANIFLDLPSVSKSWHTSHTSHTAHTGTQRPYRPYRSHPPHLHPLPPPPLNPSYLGFLPVPRLSAFTPHNRHSKRAPGFLPISTRRLEMCQTRLPSGIHQSTCEGPCE